MRFRIVELLLFTGFVGGAFAVMRAPSYLSSSIYVSCILLTLMLSLILAIIVPGEKRWFWVGFVVCGMLYTWCSGLPYVGVQPTNARDNLVTSVILDLGYEYTLAYGTIESESVSGGFPGGGGFGGGPSNLSGGAVGQGLRASNQLSYSHAEAYRSFLHAGHGLIAICLAWLGAHFASLTLERQARTRETS